MPACRPPRHRVLQQQQPRQNPRPPQPCRCGSLTHQRTSHRNCPLRTVRPTATVRHTRRRRPTCIENALRYFGTVGSLMAGVVGLVHATWLSSLEVLRGVIVGRQGGDQSTRAVKMQLTSSLSDDTLIPEILDQVDRFNSITFHGAKVLMLIVGQCLNQGTPLPAFNDTFIRQVFASCSVDAHGNETLVTNPVIQNARTAYRNVQAHGFQFTSKSHLTQAITLEARSYYVCLANHVVTNVERRLVRMLKHKMRFDLPIVVRKAYRTDLLAKHLYKKMQEGARTLAQCGIQQIQDLDGYLKDEDQPRPAQATHQVFAQIVLDMAQIVGNQSLDPSVIGQGHNWVQYFRLLRRLLQTVEQIGPTRRNRLRLFDLVPLYGTGTRHMAVDTDALYNLLRQAGHRLVQGLNKTTFGMDNLNHWRALFDFSKIPTFSGLIQTDGYSVSFVCKKTRRPDYRKRDWEPVPFWWLYTMKVVGLDPGRKDLFTTVGSVDGNPEAVVKCSTGRYREMAGFTRSQTTVKRWKENRERLMNGPSVFHCELDLKDNLSRTANMQGLLNHCRASGRVYSTLHDFYGSMRMRRLKFQNYRGKKRAMAALCKEIVGRNSGQFQKDVIVAFGGAQFSSSSRGYAPAPVKALYRELKKWCRVRLVGEYNTSAYCSADIPGIFGSKPCHTKFQRNQPNFFVKHCRHPACGMYWQRDVNAARNIRWVFRQMCRLGTKVHPLPFRRA